VRAFVIGAISGAASNEVFYLAIVCAANLSILPPLGENGVWTIAAMATAGIFYQAVLTGTSVALIGILYLRGGSRTLRWHEIFFAHLLGTATSFTLYILAARHAESSSAVNTAFQTISSVLVYLGGSLAVVARTIVKNRAS
jgi:hypothetical protein